MNSELKKAIKIARNPNSLAVMVAKESQGKHYIVGSQVTNWLASEPPIEIAVVIAKATGCDLAKLAPNGYRIHSALTSHLESE